MFQVRIRCGRCSEKRARAGGLFPVVVAHLDLSYKNACAPRVCVCHMRTFVNMSHNCIAYLLASRLFAIHYYGKTKFSSSSSSSSSSALLSNVLVFFSFFFSRSLSYLSRRVV